MLLDLFLGLECFLKDLILVYQCVDLSLHVFNSEILKLDNFFQLCGQHGVLLVYTRARVFFTFGFFAGLLIAAISRIVATLGCQIMRQIYLAYPS